MWLGVYFGGNSRPGVWYRVHAVQERLAVNLPLDGGPVRYDDLTRPGRELLSAFMPEYSLNLVSAVELASTPHD